MTDAELAAYLGVDDDPRWPQMIAKLDPKKRATYERMHYVENELNAGRVPPGVIICREHQ